MGQRFLKGLLALVPLSLALAWFHAPATWVFVASCLAVLPLAGLMGEATEHLAHHTGPALGGLLNATFGNAAELIIAFVALRAGEPEVVKASLTGSILGNLLAVLGFAMFLGGWRRSELRFNRLAAESGSSAMVLAVVGLVMPAIYASATRHEQLGRIESISLDISWILLLTYGASLLFTLKSHRRFFLPEGEGCAAALEPEGLVWSVARSAAVLTTTAILVALVSEALVHALDGAGRSIGLSKTFMGVVVVALVGNAAEHSTAVTVAMKGKMDLALGIALGSSMQIALFVAPVLVLAGHAMGTPLGLEFSSLEVAALVLSVAAVSLLIHDGKTNWFEGFQLLAIYAILAVAFYFA